MEVIIYSFLAPWAMRLAPENAEHFQMRFNHAQKIS
jgi:hypothetical protein